MISIFYDDFVEIFGKSLKEYENKVKDSLVEMYYVSYLFVCIVRFKKKSGIHKILHNKVIREKKIILEKIFLFRDVHFEKKNKNKF